MTASTPAATPDPRENERLRDHASRLLTENASLAAELAQAREALQDCADLAIGWCGPMSNGDALEKIGLRAHAVLAGEDTT